jgi:acid phosphatase type 7
VRWRSNRPIVGRVSYGTEATNLTSFVQGTNATQEHILVITNLEPSTRYFYAVGTAETNLVSGTNIFFITSPHTNKPTRIWVLGDSGTAGNGPADRVVSVRDAFHNFNGNRYVDVWLMLGDNAYNSGTDAEYQAAVFNIFTNTLPQSPLWAALGNHETAGSHSQVPTTPHLLIFSPPQQGESGGVPSGNKRYYSFDYGDVHFVCLDSMTNDRSTNGPMANWLRADLEANTKTWTIAYFHHPPYTKGSHDSDNPNADFELIEMRENIVPILEAYNVDIVMAGHSHCYERSYLLHGHYGYSESLQPEMILDRGSGDPFTADPYVKTTRGTIYIVDGSSGQATFGTLDHPVHYKSILQLGSVVIDVDGNQLVAKFLRETGAIEDTFTIIKQGGGQASTILRIVAARAENGGLTMRWTAQPGGRYQVERSDGLDSPWQPASEVLTAMAADETWTIPISAGAGRGFFRVVKLP